MLPVLSSSVGGLGTIGSRTEVLGAVLGPGVGSLCWDLVDCGWGTRAKLGTTLRGGCPGVQTASMLALPGVATELQLGRRRLGQKSAEDRMAQGGWVHLWKPGQRARGPAARPGECAHAPCPLSVLSLQC